MFGIPGMPPARVMLPEYLKNKVAPDSDVPLSLNIERDLPGGKLSMSEGGTGQLPGLPNMVQPGGGVAGAIAWPWAGINQFQGTTIPEGERVDAMIKNLLPNWEGLEVGDFKTYAEQKKDRADSGKKTRYKDDYSPLQARLSNVGIRIEPMDADKKYDRIKLKYEKKMKAIKSKIRAIDRETGINEVTRKRQLNEQYAKLRKTEDDMYRRMGE
jgi:hypothetical protein